MELIKLKPVFKSMIWGGTRLREQFGFDVSSETTGEAWVVCAHRNGASVIENGKYAGMTLTELYRSQRERFGPGQSPEFPLLIKLIDAKDNLSVQVHPDDDFARVNEHSAGKTECWLVLDCDSNSEIIIGHDFNSRAEMAEALRTGTLMSHLTHIPIKPGDFFYIPAGTVHAICANTLIYEVQQSSDVTYRIDDYGRLDASGQPRPLHLEQALAVTRFPHTRESIVSMKHQVNGLVMTTYLDQTNFTLITVEGQGETSLSVTVPFLTFSGIKGEWVINGFTVSSGNHGLLIDVPTHLTIAGQGYLILSSLPSPNKKHP